MQAVTENNKMNLRMLVLEMLLTENAYSHVIVREVLNKHNYLSQQEKSFIKRLYEGTLERRIELDYVLNQFSKVPVNKMKPVIRAVMRMGVYQILYMDAVPDAAACNEAVKLAQKKGFSSLKGFVNGVLRTIVRNKENIIYDSLSVKYSMPEWIVGLWLQQLGEETTELVLQGLLEEHPVTIRFRDIPEITEVDMDTAVKAVEKALFSQDGKIEKHPYLPYAYQLSKTDDITRLPYYNAGAFVIQDVSSMLAVEAIGFKEMNLKDRKEPVFVLDLCAAPGGKSMLVADLLEKLGVNYVVISRDVSARKVELMQENFDRCGLRHAEAVVKDALQKDEELFEKADIVIADVPCSGLGVMGKKRDIKYNITPEAVEDIIKLQEQILETAVSYLKTGGRLLFSTCTINQNENERHFEWLKKEKKLTPVSLNGSLPECLHTDTTEKGYLQLLPGVHDTDGFFISVFTKNNILSE
ncbi:MAG: 16S rRNA (cytosine(967)-C(5))-methyltransferase RsmB [Lachnospiraceae bacterium]|nr:16S rRNA (cytosine(967)-C(5))-methyltransferase RsmB [Lachnospiraceae bacterium]